MKTKIFFMLLCCAMLLQAVEPIFYCNFDSTLKPAVAKGDKTPQTAVQPRYEKGVRGQALLVGLDENNVRTVYHIPI